MLYCYSSVEAYLCNIIDERGLCMLKEIFKMKSGALLIALLMSALSVKDADAAMPGVLNSAKPDGKPHVFSFGGDKNESFMLDGKPFQMRSGEIHMQRIPKAYWRQRIKMAKAMGLNTVSTYLMWNDFEQPDGSFDFKSGSRDLNTFLKICEEEGMWVYMRPGPYICSEWDLGGLPSRLLKYPDIKLRTTDDKRFMDAQELYLKAVAKVLKPHFVKNGGSIIMIQLENEYGSYHRKGRKYMQWLKDFWTQEGFSPLSSSDGASAGYQRHVVLPGVAVGLDPGTKEQHWKVAHSINPGVPVFSGETYPGWLRHWGEGNWRPKNIDKLVAWYMETGKSFNLFVFNGGTNFRLTAGANDCRNVYKGNVTSYDYGCPVGESGTMMPAYFRLRKVIGGYLKENGPLPQPPPQPEMLEIAGFKLEHTASLHDLFPKPEAVDSKAMWLEALGQNQGLACYSTMLPAGPAAVLTFNNLHDYGHFYLGGKYLKTYVRSNADKKSVEIPARQKPKLLEIMVEGMGHINFKHKMETDRKGLYGEVKLGEHPITEWQISRMPLDGKEISKILRKASRMSDRKAASEYKGALFTAVIKIENQPLGTFFDMTKYDKGYVWVNGHLLGRYWDIGPQERLYCPESWLRKGKNVINVLDMNVNDARAVRGCKSRNFVVKKHTKNMDNVW